MALFSHNSFKYISLFSKDEMFPARAIHSLRPCMRFTPPLHEAILIRRYKRFLADVNIGEDRVTVHCPNSGSMLGCATPGMETRISVSANPRRKYPHTLEMIRDPNTWVGINTSRTNDLVAEALANGMIDDFEPITKISREVKVSAASRLDFLLEHETTSTYLEVKNCTMAAHGVALFPDAVTTRGTRHLLELAELARQGCGAAVLFCVQREDVDIFEPASRIDPQYAATLARVAQEGVQVLAWQARVNPEEICIVRKLPVRLII